MPWNNGGPGESGGTGSGGKSSGENGKKDDVRQGPWGVPPSDARPSGTQPGGNPRPNVRPGPSGGPKPQGPWGSGGNRGPNGTPPDIDEMIARGQAFVRGLLSSGPGGFSGGGGGGGGGFRRSGWGGGRGAALLLVLVIGGWLASGFYNVQPDEQGVVLRFGAFNRTTLPGLNYHVPWPVESVMQPAVTRINRVEIGYRSGSPVTVPVQDLPQESLMLTGDENIIDINFAVFWRIRDVVPFLFNTRDPADAIKAASESVMREVIGRTPIEPALGPGRSQIEQAVMTGVQAILDQYGAGVEITQVSLQKSNPPDEVIESFRDVQRANTDAERARNEAQSYANGIVPRARGDAARLVAEADADRQAAIAAATGQAQRFLSVLTAYNAAKDITMQRLYIETMQDILQHTPAVIVDDKLKGVVPYLPLGDLGLKAPPKVIPPAPSGPQPAASVPTPSQPSGGTP